MILVNRKTKELLLNGSEYNNMKEFEILLGSLIRLYDVEKIQSILDKVKNESKNEMELNYYKVSGDNKRSLIMQVKSLELPKHIEDLLLHDIKSVLIK